MPRYNYLCLDCQGQLATRLGHTPSEMELLDEVVFETGHSLDPTPEELEQATKCPSCGGHNTQKTLLGVSQFVFMRGHNWEEFKRDPNNREAMRRDMALHQLGIDDPYGRYRQSGEASDLTHKLKTGGTQQPKRQYFT